MKSNTSVAPILLFVYKRVDTLKKTVIALQANYLAKESELFIFSDAAKYVEEEPAISDVRKFIQTIDGFKKIHIIEAEINKGLATSIIDGVNQVLEIQHKIIVLEDDLITTPNFLSYMNASLDRYSDVKNVFSISGYSFNLGKNKNENSDIYFLPRGWSWGWATWKDRWEKVDWNVKDYNQFKIDRKGKAAFAKGGTDLNRMLRYQMQGKLDSWAIRWFYHQYKVGGLTLYPILSKVYNNGFDALATHTNGSSKRYQPFIDTGTSVVFEFPTKAEINPYYHKRFQNKMGVLSRLRSRLETYLLRLKNDKTSKKT
jgi:hypothetical protein